MAIADLLLQSMPLGFRFRPSDFELIDHYLKGKICGRLKADDDVIAVIDVCKCEPWDLPGKSLIKQNDMEWFFFTPKDRKYPGGSRNNRATEAGYWKATGKDRLIKSRSVLIGTKKTLVFHLGRAPKGHRTHWIMHEYRTAEPEFDSGKEGGFVLCRLFKKSEEGDKAADIIECTEMNADEMTNSDISVHAPIMYVPDEVRAGAESAVKFVQPLNQRFFPKQETSQSLPLAVHINTSQVNSSSEVDVDCVTSYPSKPLDGSCSDTVPSDTGDLETDIAGAEVEFLLGDIASYLGEDYDKSLSSPADFHKVHSFNDPDVDYSLFGGFDEGLVQGLPQDYNTVVPEGYFDYEDSVMMCLRDVADECSLDSVLSKASNAGGIGSTEAVAQDVVNLVDEGLPTLSSNSPQANTYIFHTKESYSQFAVLPNEYLSRCVSFGPNVDSLHQEHDNTASKEASAGEVAALSDNAMTKTTDDSSFAKIQVRSRQGLTNTENCVAQQGSSTRRLRLRKVPHQPVSHDDQEFETTGGNDHESTDSEALKHVKNLVKLKKTVPECISSNNDGTCTAKMKDNLVPSRAGSNSVIRLSGLFLAIVFVVVASRYLRCCSYTIL